MKTVYKITQSKLAEILMKEMNGGFLSDDPAFKGASYRTAEPSQDVTPEPPVRKISVQFTEEELNLVEAILEGVQPDNKNEEQLLFTIKHKLRDTLIGSK